MTRAKTLLWKNSTGYVNSQLFRGAKKPAKGDHSASSLCLSVWNNSAPTRRILMKVVFISRKYVEKFQVSMKSDKYRLLTRKLAYFYDDMSPNSSFNNKYCTK